MKDFRPIWKALANSKSATCADVVILCALRAIRSNVNADIPGFDHIESNLRYHINKAFSPSKKAPHPYQAVHKAVNRALSDLNWRTRLFQGPMDAIFDNDEEKDLLILALQKVRYYNGTE